MQKKKIILIFLITMSFFTSCKQNGNQNEPLVRSVKVTNPVSLGTVTERSLPGIVKENQIINLGFKAAGQILHIYVKEGDYVKEGQTLAKLDDKDYRLQLSAVELQYNQLKTEVERLEELHKRKSISGNDYEKALMGLNAMKIQLEGYQNQVAYTVLRAPSAGYIQSVNFKKDEMIDAGRPMFTLMDISSVIIEIDLPANLYLEKDNFEKILCRTNLMPDKEFPLEILSISHKSTGSQLYKTQLALVDSSQNSFTAGMNVEVKINLKDENGTSSGYTLPMNCVFTENGRNYVWVLSSESNVYKREVEIIGMDDNGSIIITGVSPTDQVISAGVNYLQESEKVIVITDSKTNIGGML